MCMNGVNQVVVIGLVNVINFNWVCVVFDWCVDQCFFYGFLIVVGCVWFNILSCWCNDLVVGDFVIMYVNLVV